jgi:hypothetical protein
MKVMLGARRIVIAFAAALALAPAAQADDKVLEWDVMPPVVRPFTGGANPIRGINGGGVPWQIARGEGSLRANGRLEVEVRGLVIASTGVNPVATFRATVSCLTVDESGAAATVNRTTDPSPATPQGDAEIRAHVDLPTPCIAPIVFVANGNTGAWFAATGR